MRLALPLLLATCMVSSAQDAVSRLEPPSVRVHGEATISVEPDEAQLDIGVVTQGPTSDLASAANTRRAQAVAQSLHELFPSANITTVNLSVNPNFKYPKEGAPSILGYTASNTVRVRLDDISQLRKCIESATKAGATSINRLNFTLRNENDARAKALAEAASQAEAGAQALATKLKLKLGRVLHIEEGQPVIVSPAPEIDIGKAQSTDMAPTSMGNIQIHANVNLTYELLQ